MRLKAAVAVALALLTVAACTLGPRVRIMRSGPGGGAMTIQGIAVGTAQSFGASTVCLSDEGIVEITGVRLNGATGRMRVVEFATQLRALNAQDVGCQVSAFHPGADLGERHVAR